LTQRKLSVAFCPTGTTTSCTNAPLLFATNNQINMMVPGGLTTGNAYDVIVTFGYGTSPNLVTSSPMTVNVVAANPGIFAIGADGQGAGAILGSNYAVISAANPASMRSTAADSDTVQIYMTGLGVPTSTALNSGTPGTLAAPADCLNPTEYLSTLNGSSGTLTSLDGAIIQSALLFTGRLAPCFASVPSVSVGGQPAGTVGYAGWVADSIAGLYQVNVPLPGTGAGPFLDVNGVSHSTITSPVQLPITVTSGTHVSQTGAAKLACQSGWRLA